MEKKKARLATKRRIAALSKKDKQAGSQAIVNALLELPELQQARTVMAFASLGDEADLFPLWSRLHESGKTLLFPVTLGPAGRMDAHIATNFKKDLKPGRFGIAQPHDHLPVDPRAIDFIFVPALAYDLRGHRLGRGGGYYDRFLAARAPQAFRCGVAFECQVLENIPYREHDCRVHALVTEQRLRRFRTGANCSSRNA